MPKKTFLAFILAVAICFYSHLVQASLVSPPQYTQDILNQSQIIVVARIVSFTQDKKSAPDADSPKSHSGNIIVTSNDDMVPSGNYSFDILRTIKGHSDKNLQIHLPALSRRNYGFADFEVRLGDDVILCLTKGSDGQVAPTELGVPLIQLGKNYASEVETNTGDVSTEVFGLMLRSLGDPVIRQANTALLRDVNSPIVAKGLLPFINDSNDSVKDNVLYCMAVNQVVSAIPKIVQLQLKEARKDGGTYCVTALQLYDNPQAVPLLNPLLFQNDEYIRINSVMALQKIADTSSIPYLMLALHDPDPQNVVPYTAYLTLHKIIPKLPKDANDFDYTQPIPPKNLMPIYVWWNDELMGIHFHPAIQAAKIHVKQATNVVDQLNIKMFDPDPSVRLKLVRILAVKADAASVPFLVLALQDPESSVSYVAYKTLHRLIPSLGAVEDSKSFAANHAAATQPIYDWWRDELLGKHLPK